jgi:hypothetical protein
MRTAPRRAPPPPRSRPRVRAARRRRFPAPPLRRERAGGTAGDARGSRCDRLELAASAEHALALGWLDHCSIVPPVPDGPRSVRYRAELRPFVCPLSRDWSVIGPDCQPFCAGLLAFYRYGYRDSNPNGSPAIVALPGMHGARWTVRNMRAAGDFRRGSAPQTQYLPNIATCKTPTTSTSRGRRGIRCAPSTVTASDQANRTAVPGACAHNGSLAHLVR